LSKPVCPNVLGWILELKFAIYLNPGPHTWLYKVGTPLNSPWVYWGYWVGSAGGGAVGKKLGSVLSKPVSSKLLGWTFGL
jgi:hypothetical protein